jgi:hypothetical protein
MITILVTPLIRGKTHHALLFSYYVSIFKGYCSQFTADIAEINEYTTHLRYAFWPSPLARKN